ncbi:unnamed protein product, partial [Didymodactylos carnosus]
EYRNENWKTAAFKGDYSVYQPGASSSHCFVIKNVPTSLDIDEVLTSAEFTENNTHIDFEFSIEKATWLIKKNVYRKPHTATVKVEVIDERVKPKLLDCECVYLAVYKKIKKHTDQIIPTGYLNARHQHWGDHVNNTVGKKLYEKITEYDLEIANEFGVPTYFDSQGSSSIIDLTLHTEELLLFSPKCSVVKQHLNQTDHELIEINLHDLEWKKSTFQPFQSMRRWNYSRADWTTFVQNIDDAVRATSLEGALIRNKDEIDKFAKQIDDILLNAAHATIPKVIVNKNSKYWWTLELTMKRKLVTNYLPAGQFVSSSFFL